MKTERIDLPKIKLVEVAARTNNKNEFNPSTAKIGNTISNYFHHLSNKKITNLIDPNVSYSVYTAYESDYNGDYTYLFGQEVNFPENLPNELTSLTVAPQTYIKFTTEAGPKPQIVIDMWQKIWQMTDNELGGERNYIADFEIYDKRALDPVNSIVDIYVGIKR